MGYDKMAIGLTTLPINSKSILQLESTTKGFLPPRMTTAQRNAMGDGGSGVAEVTTVRVVNKPNNGQYFILSDSPTTNVCFYAKRNNQSDNPPDGVCNRNVVFEINSNENDLTVIATILNSKINTDIAFNSTVTGTTVTVTNVTVGDVPDGLSASPAYTVAVVTQGVNAGLSAIPEGLNIYNLTNKRMEYFNGSEWLQVIGTASTGTFNQAETLSPDLISTPWVTLPGVTPARASLPSDRKLKKEIKDLTESYIDKIMDLRPVSFVWKDNLNPDIGFIAQEVKKVFPNLVEEDAGYMGVNYQKMVVPLVKAFQEQEIEYKKTIRTLEERISRLERLIEKK
jgi:Chaperone of endosialidase